MNVVDVNIAGRVAQRSTLAAWQQSLFNNIPLLISELLLYYRLSSGHGKIWNLVRPFSS